jgi:hypothetical protein
MSKDKAAAQALAEQLAHSDLSPDHLTSGETFELWRAAGVVLADLHLNPGRVRAQVDGAVRRGDPVAVRLQRRARIRQAAGIKPRDCNGRNGECSCQGRALDELRGSVVADAKATRRAVRQRASELHVPAPRRKPRPLPTRESGPDIRPNMPPEGVVNASDAKRPRSEGDPSEPAGTRSEGAFEAWLRGEYDSSEFVADPQTGRLPRRRWFDGAADWFDRIF